MFVIGGSKFSDDEGLSIWISEYDENTNKYTLGSIETQSSYTDAGGDKHDAVSGELNIESVTDNSTKGTFHFKTKDGMNVTDGKFDLKWK